MPNKFICTQGCGETTTAKPCEASYGRVEGGDFRTEAGSPIMCPACAALWLADNCMSIDEKRLVCDRLARALGRPAYRQKPL